MPKIIDFGRFELLWEWLTGIRITEYISRLLCVSVSDFLLFLFYTTAQNVLNDQNYLKQS